MKIIMENKKQFIFIVLAILAYFFFTREKIYDNDEYKKYQTKTNKEMQDLKKELKGIAYSFSQDNKISDAYKDTMYDCFGYLIYNKEENGSFNDSMNICKKEYIIKNEQAIYYNEAWLREEFSHWNGTYIPLERIIQKHLKERKSYEHLKTTTTMHFTDERPHMFVSINFRGANIHGYILDRTMEVKVDAKTKELYDLK